ncbi:MAG: ribosome maturation factor RimM [Armatimonadota bacterium]
MDYTGNTPRLKFITIGKIIGRFGIRGQVKIQILTDFPERFFSGEELYIHIPSSPDPVTISISGAFNHKGAIVANISNCSSPEDADKIKGAEIKITEAQLKKLDDNTYYHFDLIGMEVYNTKDSNIGKIKDIISLPSNDVYIVKLKNGKELLVPAINRYIKKVDVDNKKIIIEEPEYTE